MQLSPHSSGSVDLALDSMAADEMVRRVALLVSKVDGPRSAMRVIAGFRDATTRPNHPTGNTVRFVQVSAPTQADSTR
jgi:hypothetical protein